MMDTPSHAKQDQGAPARLADWYVFRVEEAHVPEAVRLLRFTQGRAHLQKVIQVERATRMVTWHAVEHLGQAGIDPAIASTPVHLFAVGRTFVEVPLIPVIQMVLRIEKHSPSCQELAVGEVQVALVPGRL